MSAIDDRRWSDLGEYLHDDFSCRYVHTGESFNREAWIRLNAEYPGFEHLLVEEIVGDSEPLPVVCMSRGTGVRV